MAEKDNKTTDSTNKKVLICAIIGAIIGSILGILAYTNNWLG